MGFTTGRVQFVIGNPVDHVAYLFHVPATAKVTSTLTDDVKVLVKAVAVSVQADIGEIQVGDRFRERQRACTVRTEGNNVRCCGGCHPGAYIRGGWHEIVRATTGLHKRVANRVGQRSADGAA